MIRPAGVLFAFLMSSVGSAADALMPRFVKTVPFKPATAEISDPAPLEKIVRWTAAHPTYRAQIEGYLCEDDSSSLKNEKGDEAQRRERLLTLAEDRAKRVRDTLIARGLKAENLSTVAFGLAASGEPCKVQVVMGLASSPHPL